MEAAECIVESNQKDTPAELTIVSTPSMHTIEQVCTFLNADVISSCKAVVYQKNLTDEYVVVFIRGDLEINETKLTNYIGEQVHAAVITEESGIKAGFIGPYNFKPNAKCTVLYDRSLKEVSNLVCGANKEDYHYTGLNIERDCGEVQYNDFAKIVEGGICPVCGKHSITISRGIEVGNIFQLGTKYTKAMNMQYQDQNGESKYPIMGCYGIGVGRLAASVCEKYHDDYGPIWPMSIAPWQVHICCLRADDANAKNLADDLYNRLTEAHIEVIYDDRAVRPGVMFSDADLLGVPVRVIVSPRNLEQSIVEVVTRDKNVQMKVSVADAVSEIKKLVNELNK
jgi:prolyl-tRNA synthetase